MTPLSITMNLTETPWVDQADKLENLGTITRIGLLPGGMNSGDPAAALLIALPDGSVVAAQTSWRLLLMAVKAMDVSPVAPKLRDIP